MAQYAQDTKVTIDKSRSEIEATLKRYGADAFAYGWDDLKRTALITFRLRGRVVRLSPPVVDTNQDRFRYTTNGVPISTALQKSRVEQAQRQSWRALALYVKALCEAIENEIVTVDAAFMAAIVLPNGQTVGEWAGPQLTNMVAEGRMPALLPGG